MKGLYMVRHFDKLPYGNGSKFIGHFFVGRKYIIIHDPFPSSFGFRKEIPWAMTLEQPDFKHESSGKIRFFSACPTSWCSTCPNSACSRPMCFSSAVIAIWERGFFAGWWFCRGVETTNQFGKGGSFSGSVWEPQVIVALWWLSSRWPVPWRLFKKGSSFLLWYYVIIYTLYIYIYVFECKYTIFT